MTDNREKVLATIKALLAKTVEAGATEAEEMAAAEKARELIDKYQLDLGAEELKREGFVQRTIKLEHLEFAFARRITRGINAFCEVKTWTDTYTSGYSLFVLGLASDADLAAYLVRSLTTFAMGGANIHIAAQRKMAIALGSPMTAATSRDANRSYLLGCAERINSRLCEMAAERKAKAVKPRSSRALVTLDKKALISAEMERCGIRLQAGSALTGASDGSSFAAGSAHGAKATLGRPVGGGRIAGLIERK
jgi:hypothetical protein